MKKQQQWTLLFKVFFSSKTTRINSSSSPSYNIARPCCSLATKTTNKKQHQQQLHMMMLLEKKKLPLLIIPYSYNHIGSDHGSSTNKKKERKLVSTVCNDTLGFISLFHAYGNDDDVVKINNKAEEVYKLYLPEIADRRICGSSEGWLVTVHENGEIQLLNPFSKVLVHLPSLTTFPEVVAKFVSEEIIAAGTFVPEDQRGLCYLVDEDSADRPPLSVYGFSSSPMVKIHGSRHFRDKFLDKVVTNTNTTTIDANSTTTTTTSVVVPTVVMAIYGCCRKLAFCRPSTGINGNDDEQNKWISCLEGDRGGWEDVTYYKGNFYAVSLRYGHVSVVKGLDGPSPFVESIIQQPDLEPYNKSMNYIYLVESSSSSSGGGGGDLLIVMRDVRNKVKLENEEEEERPYRTIEFRVLKLDFNRKRPSWVEVTNLGEDCALFIGYNHSFSFSASKFPGCRGNCVYFTDNNRLINYFPTGGHDIGVCNLEDGSVEKLNYETSPSQLFMPPPIWYVPN